MFNTMRNKSIAGAGKAVLLMFVLLGATVLRAQSGSGKIAGVVTDPTGASVPGATVTVTNQLNGTVRSDKTDATGTYTFPALPAGTYTVAITALGFETNRQLGIVLDAASDRNVNVQMVVGQVTQEVVVSSVSQNQVETSNAEIASTITGRQIEDISLNGRNYLQLVRLLPGTVITTLDPFALQLGSMGQYVNGVRGASIFNQADGIILEDISSNISVFAVPNADSIAETRVLAASFDAENPSPYGGATINVITKSGTNQFHGNVFEFNRNTLFNAKADFASANLPLHFNDYGFTLGGPVYLPGHFNEDRKKLFFFVSEEWKIIHQSTISTGVVPTTQQLQGIFPQTTATGAAAPQIYQPGTRIPYTTCPQQPSLAGTGYCVPSNAISSISKALFSLYPAPNIAGAFPGTTNFTLPLANKLDNREDRVNIDYVPSTKDLISIRWSREQNNQSAQGALGIIPTVLTPRPAFLWSGAYTHTFSSNLLNTLIFGETLNKYHQTPDTSRITLGAVGVAISNPFPGNVLGVIPNFAITGYTGFSTPAPDTKAPENLSLSDDVSWVKGHHTMKFGIFLDKTKNDEHNLSSSTTQGSVSYSTAASNTTTNPLADAILGNFYQYSQSSIPGFFILRYSISEGYAQDSWKANQHLALDYGIRYSYSELPYSGINNMSTFNPALYIPGNAPTVAASNGALSGNYNPYNGLEIVGSGFPAAAAKFFPTLVNSPSVQALFQGAPRSFSNTPKTNVAPRIGIAYDVFGNGKTAIRGAYGIFFMRQNTFEYSNVTQNLPFNSNASIFNGSISNPAGVPGTVFPTSLYTFPLNNFQTAYIQTRNLGIQQQLPKQMILDVNYVGNQGLHLPIILNINQLQPGTTISTTGVKNTANANALRQYKGYADIDQQAYVDTTNYNSLQSTIGRRVSHGLNFSTSFTWSKTMEGTSQNLPATVLPENSYNYKADYSVADIHRSKVVTGNSSYELPFFRTSTNRYLKESLGGWVLSGVFSFQTGAPLNVTLNSDYAGISTATGTGGMAERPLVNGTSPYTHQDCSGLKKFNCQYLNNTVLPNTLANQGNFAAGGAFAFPLPGTFGNASRNYVFGPKYTSTDASLFKHFRFGERYDAQFRAEGFNVFNRGNLTTVSTTLGTANFGQVTAAGVGRVLQFGAKFAF